MIPILNIENFNQQISAKNYFYSNHLDVHLKNNVHHFDKPHKHDFYLCVFVIEGEGVHEIDFNNYDIKPGRVFFLKPGQTHYWSFSSEVKGYIFFHTFEFFSLSMNELQLNEFPFYTLKKSYLDLSPNNIQYFIEAFKNINDEFHSNQIFKRASLLSLVNLIYINFLRTFNQKSIPEQSQSVNDLVIVEKLYDLITTHFKHEKRATFYAEQLHITVRHLNRITKKVLGKTFTQLLHEMIVLEAKRLLVHTREQLTTIAEELGFQDYANFSKFFKNKTTESPTSFRKRY
ncbi:AraC family transcriptional regulator [Tenacibaculum amylolyticum]|uniref:AraC family transcriptional regulator n=1 Tax=Tenacibaculum amylolyticum TaxID=104269 RepID=UPI0038946901